MKIKSAYQQAGERLGKGSVDGSVMFCNGNVSVAIRGCMFRVLNS